MTARSIILLMDFVHSLENLTKSKGLKSFECMQAENMKPVGSDAMIYLLDYCISIKNCGKVHLCQSKTPTKFVSRSAYGEFQVKLKNELQEIDVKIDIL